MLGLKINGNEVSDFENYIIRSTQSSTLLSHHPFNLKPVFLVLFIDMLTK